MVTLEHVIEQAMKRQGFRSYRELGRASGMPDKGGYIAFYRSGRSLPSDGQMIRLAKLAEMDQDEALLWLNVWRSKDDDAKSRYKKMIATIASAAAVITVAPGFTQINQQHADTADHDNVRVVNIMRNKTTLWIVVQADCRMP